ncbi:33198_t:CDS:1, partial [Racocetra persica]
KPVNTTKSKRGRKAYITPEKTDTTGKMHFMIVKRVPTVVKNKKKSLCKNCDINDEYINTLSERINKIEHLIKDFEKGLKNFGQRLSNVDNTHNNVDFLQMDTNSLIELSKRPEFVPFNNINSQPQFTPYYPGNVYVNQTISPQYFGTMPFDNRPFSFYQN